MISYIFNNDYKMDSPALLDFIKNTFQLQEIENVIGSTILSNTDMLIDIDPKYISILLYNESINIKTLKKLLLEKHYAKERTKNN